MTYNTSTENTFLIENDLPFRVESRNLSPVSIFCQLYLTWYTCSISFMQILSVVINLNNSFFCCHLTVISLLQQKGIQKKFLLTIQIKQKNSFIKHFIFSHVHKLPHCFPQDLPAKIQDNKKIPILEIKQCMINVHSRYAGKIKKI